MGLRDRGDAGRGRMEVPREQGGEECKMLFQGGRKVMRPQGAGKLFIRQEQARDEV